MSQAGPKAWNTISRGGRDAAGVMCAREIFGELCRDEAAEDWQDEEWFDCEEWPTEVHKRHEEATTTPPWTTEKLSEVTPRKRNAEDDTETLQLLDFTLEEPELPVRSPMAHHRHHCIRCEPFINAFDI